MASWGPVVGVGCAQRTTGGGGEEPEQKNHVQDHFGAFWGLVYKRADHLTRQKPALACFYCRNCKIACGPGPSVDGAARAGCNQCQRCALKCEYPLDCRRGKNKKKTKQPASATPPPEEGVKEGKDKDGGEADVQVDEGITGEGEEDAVKADELHLNGVGEHPRPPSAPVPRDTQAWAQDPAESGGPLVVHCNFCALAGVEKASGTMAVSTLLVVE
ncbi:hypothetical protein FB45DRAFT_1113736 [Roridomyces roridus]|uniref:Zn(2)-C6 fungal-type domain-containing protein n=1 Tax=Roridomyces roridus TaxID=1738132 RepID=A0AAD7CA23_9AGAR|nr:hypothetical protein FB45DRAFT_1113736 [Roridomyces roridus]